ncbi:replication protein A 70 kDa DNA-binding subunit [Caerostris extrusa]|uniref:Replication protein A 70 kDa DNA-binding subunit n=1 Tax=Caerostris extrusa TaxID=172846 RepID=A0AAV4YEC9_CAEEX|nr:replication protein A 70 kDa DNA-binding subunit [Caerostris extrusa]
MACSSSSPKLPLLSSGSISRILNEELIDHAILQILGYKIVPGSGIERFRLLLNDGETLFPFALLSTQLNYLIETRKLEKFTILKLCKYVSTPILPDKKIILCLEVKPLVPGSIVKDQIYSKTNQSNLCNILNEEQETQPIIQEIPTEESASLINDYHSCKLNNSHVPQNELNSHFGKNTYNSRNIDQPSTSGTSLNTKKDRLSGQYNNQMFNINCNNQKSFLNTQTISQSTLAVIPITSLTPYQNKWAIKARVVYKTSVKKYSNAKGSGLLFTFFLLDETGEIRVTAFDKQAELLHSFLQLNRVYYVSNAKVLLARNNSPVKNDFEITVNANTNIELADDTSTIPNLEFNFVSISEIFKMPKDSLC